MIPSAGIRIQVQDLWREVWATRRIQIWGCYVRVLWQQRPDQTVQHIRCARDSDPIRRDRLQKLPNLFRRPLFNLSLSLSTGRHGVNWAQSRRPSLD